MDRIHIGNFGSAYNGGNVQITLGGRRVADTNRFIRQMHMRRIGVRNGINRHRPHAHLAAGTNDTKRYFAAVSD